MQDVLAHFRVVQKLSCPCVRPKSEGGRLRTQGCRKFLKRTQLHPITEAQKGFQLAPFLQFRDPMDCLFAHAGTEGVETNGDALDGIRVKSMGPRNPANVFR